MENIPLYHVWQYTEVDRAFWRERLDPWLPRRIFDAHLHVFDPRFRRSPLTLEKRREYWANEVFEPITAAELERCQAVVFPGREFSCLAFGSVDPDFDLEGENADLQAECVRRGWYRLAQTRPQWPADRVAWELDQPRTLGVKVYYTLIGDDLAATREYLEASIFDFLPRHQLEMLDRRHAWVTLHVPKADRLGHPDNIAEIREIRRKYPNVVLVIAHLGRCYTLPHAEEAFPHFADDEGLFFDTSAVINPDVLRLALETFGPRRLLYGSDTPIFYMRGRRQYDGRAYINRTSYPFYFNREREPAEIEARYTLFMYEDLWAIRQACEQVSLDRAAIEDIFSENAARLIRSIQNWNTGQVKKPL
jgi:uncharacterized protein